MRMSRLFLPVLLTFGLVACGDSNKPAVSGVTGGQTQDQKRAVAKAPGYKIALVMKTLTNPFFVEMERGARRAEKEFSIELQVKTAAQETSIEQQIQIIDGLIVEKIDALVIAPGDSQRLVPVLKKAQMAGVKIVNLDNQLDPTAIKDQAMAMIPFISVDNQTASHQAAKFVADQIKNPTKAVILEGIRGAENARLRMMGAERAFAENTRIKLVAKESANWKIDEGYEVTKKLFKANPDIGLIFCANDMMALGAIKHLQEAGKNNVLVASYDALEAAKAAVKAGTLAVTVDQQAAEQGYQGIRIAIQLLAGKPVAPVTLVETRLVTTDTLK